MPYRYSAMFFPNIVSVPSKSSKDDVEGQFTPGDNVEVTEGELMNLQGKIVSVEGNKIVMLPFHEDLKVGRGFFIVGLHCGGFDDQIRDFTQATVQKTA